MNARPMVGDYGGGPEKDDDNLVDGSDGDSSGDARPMVRDYGGGS
ncbi:hypothetical protein OROGR_024404 [Orobanche gracilis]